MPGSTTPIADSSNDGGSSPAPQGALGRPLQAGWSPDAVRETSCDTCSLKELCIPLGLSGADLKRLDDLVEARVNVLRGDCLYRRGDPFKAIFAVRTGFFKTRTASNKREHVTGFQMTGEVLGLDGLGTDWHTCDAVALEDSQVCSIAFDQLASLAREVPRLQRHIHRLIGHELDRDQDMLRLLGTKRAEQRLAAFLVNLSLRLGARGFSASAMVLRMTREEIGSYLGLKLETVSRCLSRFAEAGVLAVRNRDIQILVPGMLASLVETDCA